MSLYNRSPLNLFQPKRAVRYTRRSTIFDVPWELLAQILELALREEIRDISHRIKAAGPWRLSVVCRKWRSIVFGTPSLWAMVHLQVPASYTPQRSMPQRPANLIRLHLNLSQGRMLTVRVTGALREDEGSSEDPFFLGAVDELLFAKHRWRQAKLHGPMYRIHDFLQEPRTNQGSDSFPFLEQLSLVHWAPTKGKRDRNPRTTVGTWEQLMQSTPRLRKLVIQMPWDSDQAFILTNILYMCWNTVHHIELNVSEKHVIVTINDEVNVDGKISRTSALPPPRAGWVTVVASRRTRPANPTLNVNRGMMYIGQPWTIESISGENTGRLRRSETLPRAERLLKTPELSKYMFLVNMFTLYLNDGSSNAMQATSFAWIKGLKLVGIQHLNLVLGPKFRPLDLGAPMGALHAWTAEPDRFTEPIDSLTLRWEGSSVEGVEYILQRFNEVQCLRLINTPHCSKVMQALSTGPLICPDLEEVHILHPASLDASAVFQYLRARGASYNARETKLIITGGHIKNDRSLQEWVHRGNLEFTRSHIDWYS